VIIVEFKLTAGERSLFVLRKRGISENTRFPAFSAGVDQIIACWVITACRMISLFRNFGRTSCIHLQGLRIWLSWKMKFPSQHTRYNRPEGYHLISEEAS
jgi:hypothetical protein